MALKAVLATLAGLAADVSKLYKQDGDRFVLDVEPSDGFALENIEGLKKTMGKEITARKAAEAKLEAFADLDPDKARDALSKVDKMKDWKPDEKVKEQLNATIAEVQKKFDDEKKKLVGENTFLQGQLDHALVVSVATQAIAAEKGVPELLLPHVRARTKVVREGDKMVVQVVNDAGNPDFDIVNGQTVPKTVDSLVKSMKDHKVYGRAFEPNGSSGAGSGGSKGSNSSITTGSNGVLQISRMDSEGIRANMAKIADGSAVVVD
jgi:hypothetical protein